jgi:succinyl-diaminopimelate desuccinylase
MIYRGENAMGVIKLLEELIAINSINPFKTVKIDGQEVGLGNEKEIVNFLYEQLIIAGFSVKRQLVQEEDFLINEVGQKVVVPARYNLLAEKGLGNKSLLFLAHVDTVDVKKKWNTNPFNATLRFIDGKERIYGLGSNDMKAGIAAILAATCEIDPQEFKIKVAFVVDEEFWSFGAIELIKSDFLEDVKAALVPEIGEAAVKTNHQKIILGRLGRTEYKFILSGYSVHGAQALNNKKAVNAVHESVKLQKIIIDYCHKCNKLFTCDNMSIMNSAFINFQKGGQGTLSIPDQAEFILDRSFVMNESMLEELSILRELVADAYNQGIIDHRVGVEIKERRVTPAAGPYFISPDNTFVKLVTEHVKKVYGDYEYGIGYSVADENRIAELGIPVIVLGPEGNNSHSPNEWVDIESLKKLVITYKKICQNFVHYLNNLE